MITTQVEWDGWDRVAVPDVGGVTQAKRLDRLPQRITEVVRLMTGRAVDEDDVVLAIDFPGAAEAATLRADREAIADAERELAERTRRWVLRLRQQGASLRDIAHLTGISHQRAHQLIADH